MHLKKIWEQEYIMVTKLILVQGLKYMEPSKNQTLLESFILSSEGCSTFPKAPALLEPHHQTV